MPPTPTRRCHSPTRPAALAAAILLALSAGPVVAREPPVDPVEEPVDVGDVARYVVELERLGEEDELGGERCGNNEEQKMMERGEKG